MASERQQTKRLVRGGETEDPELDTALALSREKQLEIARENNRHKEALQGQELGSFGKLLGGPNQAPLSVAAMVALISVVAAVLCGCGIVVFPAASVSLEKVLALFVGLISTALAYLFGARSTRAK